MAKKPVPADQATWNRLTALADQVGTSGNPVTQIRCKGPLQDVVDNGGAQAIGYDDDEFTGVVTSDGKQHALT